MVELVGSGVVEIFALEVDLAAAQLIGEALAVVDGGGAPLEFAANAAQLANKFGGVADSMVGVGDLFEGRLYIQTGKKKSVSMQIHANPRIEICAFMDGTWLRVAAKAIEDDRREARVSMLEAYPDLRRMYDPDDGNTEVFYLEDATAVFSSFTAPSRTITF